MINYHLKKAGLEMNYAIVYATTAGGTEQSAKIIKDKLCFEHQVSEEEIDIIDLSKKKSIEFEKYGRCIIGTGIYAGKPHKLVKGFVKSNLDQLLEVPVSIFICSLADDKENEGYRHVFPKELLEHASPVSFFGGMVIFKRLNVLTRFIMKMITKSKKNVHQLKHGVINEFVKKIAEE